MERLHESKWVYVLLSILLAVIFWFYVRVELNPSSPIWFYNVPVVQTGKNVLTQQGLTVASLSHEKVDIRIEAPASVLDTLTRSRKDITVTVDVSRCKEGENKLAYVPNWPANVSADSIAQLDQNPDTITATVEKLDTRTMDVEFRFQGKVADGYQAGTPAINPETVVLSGPVEQVSQVDKVVAILEDEDLNEQFAGELPLTLLNAEGQALSGLEVALDTTSVYVVLPVVVTKEVPLTVNLIAGGGATEADADWEIEPKTIIVSGLEADVEKLTEISLGSVDLSKVVGTKTITRPIELDPSLENVSGITSANIEITINGLATKTLDASRIDLTNEPFGYRAVSETQSITVVIRGKEEDLANVDASKLRIVADLSNITSQGTQRVPVKVYLDAASSVGVIGDYFISVNISR